jgi:hypothetical protein
MLSENARALHCKQPRHYFLPRHYWLASKAMDKEDLSVLAETPMI